MKAKTFRSPLTQMSTPPAIHMDGSIYSQLTKDLCQLQDQGGKGLFLILQYTLCQKQLRHLLMVPHIMEHH